MDEMLKKQDVLDAIEKKMKVVNEADGDADVVLGLAAAMSVVKKMEGQRMTNAEKFEEVFGTDIERQYSTKTWWEQEFVPNKSEIPTRWIPVGERLPEFTIKNVVGTRFTEDVLVYDGTDLRVGYFARKDKLDRDYWVVYGEDYFEPIAWMPLPEPYKASPTGAERSDKE